MFKIDIDERRQMMSLTLTGLMDDTEAALFMQAVQCAFIRQIGARPYVVMIDTTQFNIQSQSVIGMFAKRVAMFPNATRIALVNGHSLVRMQLKRVLARDYARYFETVAEALPWLLDQWPPAGDVPHPVGAAYRAPPRPSAFAEQARQASQHSA